MRHYDAPLRRIGLEVIDLQCAQAVQRARAVERARFAATLMAALPPGPMQGQV